jgi:hypothetical protein
MVSDSLRLRAEAERHFVKNAHSNWKMEDITEKIEDTDPEEMGRLRKLAQENLLKNSSEIVIEEEPVVELPEHLRSYPIRSANFMAKIGINNFFLMLFAMLALPFFVQALGLILANLVFSPWVLFIPPLFISTSALPHQKEWWMRGILSYSCMLVDNEYNILTKIIILTAIVGTPFVLHSKFFGLLPLLALLTNAVYQASNQSEAESLKSNSLRSVQLS